MADKIVCPHCGGDITEHASSAVSRARRAKAKKNARDPEKMRAAGKKGAERRWKMKKMVLLGRSINEDNGSGYRLADEFPGREFFDNQEYVVRYNGVQLDRSTVKSITEYESDND